MPKTKTIVWIHAVFRTKNSHFYFYGKAEHVTHSLIIMLLEEMGCSVKAINGMPDHVHILFRLNKTIPLSKTIKDIKGASSRFLNKCQFFDSHFAWQRGYGAFAVYEKDIELVAQYINNQKDRHRNQERYLGEMP